MNRSFSIYLDLVRFTAAFLVYLYHSNQRFLSEALLPASTYGHSSVIVFFVLSGFVIAYVTATKESDFPRYAASRTSRVFSVTVPAIVLTVVLDSIGRRLYPEIYGGYPFDQFLPRIVGSLLLANEIWTVSITSFSNVPYWSICYEWWYYVAFALITFLPRQLGLPLAAVLLLALGPKIAVLAPIWGLGVLLFRWRALQGMPIGAAWVLALASVLGIIAFHAHGVGEFFTEWLKSQIGETAHKNMTFSKFFIGDYLLGLLVFTNFAAMRRVLHTHGLGLHLIERPVRFLAGFTFTLYLLHQPMFLFWGAVVRGDPGGHGYWFTVTALTLLSIGVVGHFTENKRHLFRKALHQRFDRLPGRNLRARFAVHD